ncbi:MAG: HAMP domain-containing histidine kinase [Vicinamibacteria bacterium]|nr:HAMP domain-containing histidine kinase [Vicinamibacteria bacterium]
MLTHRPPHPAGRRWAGTGLALGLIAPIAWVDYVTGPDIGFSLFYLVPIVTSAWLLGRVSGLIVAVGGSVGWFVADLLWHVSGAWWISAWNAATRLLIYVSLALLTAHVRADRDVLTERARALDEANRALEARRQQQLALKDQVLSHVSHELRTPLTAIYQFVTLLADGLAGELSATQQEYLQVVLRNVRQLRTMIGDLLESTRAETGKLLVEPRAVDAGGLITDLVRTLRSVAAEKGLALDTQLDPELPAVRADPARLRQVVTNLLDNALKFTPPGGSVRVEAARDPEQAGFARIVVEDSGRGMSADVLDHIFDRLYQVEGVDDAARRGLGLGLYICRELVERQGGRIWATSVPGEGSTMTFTLPFHRATEDENA